MELFDFGIPALDKALNLTATVLLLLALGMLLIRVILRLCDRAFDRSERLARAAGGVSQALAGAGEMRKRGGSRVASPSFFYVPSLIMWTLR